MTLFHPDLFDMTAEAEAHRREDLVLKQVEIAGGKAFEQRRGQDVRGDTLVVRGSNRPAPLARIRDLAAEPLEVRICGQCLRGQVEEPRAHDAAATPHFSD